MKGGVPKIPPKKFEYRSFKNYNKSEFIKDLNQVPWSVVKGVENVDVAVFLWEKLFSEIANEHAPLKIKRAKGSKTPWVTSKLAEMKRDKDYHLKKARSTNSTYHWGMYRKLRNYTNHEEKNLKSKYFCQIIEEAKGDSCEMWRAIKQVLPSTKQSTVSSISENGKWHTENLSVAKIMNQYFVSMGKVLAKPFPNISTAFTSDTPSSKFHLDNVNVNFVRNALKSLKPNKAVGLDKLSARLLKDASDVIAQTLTGLINKSFSDGVFPRVWKCAKVIALFKDGDKSIKHYYRPISILPTISKIMERSAHIQLSPFLEVNRLLSQSHFGFRLKRSTSTPNRLYRSSPRKYGQRIRDGNSVPGPSQGVRHCRSSAPHQQTQVTRSSREKLRMVPLISHWSSSKNNVCKCIVPPPPQLKSPWECRRVAFWGHCYSWCILMEFNLNCGTQR